MLQHNTMKLFEAHGTMTCQILDSEMVEPFSLGETQNQTAQKLRDRAQHLRTLFTAQIDYARIVVEDMEHNSWANRDIRSVLDSMADDVKDLTGLIEKLAQRTAPDATVDRPVEKPVHIKELIAEHLSELTGPGRDYHYITNWARNHGVQTRGLPAFWTEFTIALFHKMKENPRFPPGE